VLGLRPGAAAASPSPAAQAGIVASTPPSVHDARAGSVAPVVATGDGPPLTVPPLTVQGARRHFGGVAAIDGVDLVVERGQIHAIIGPNGSGKTTLLNLITGYYALDAGTISIGATRLDTLRGTVPVARLGVARTFQTPKLNPFETAMGNVLSGADQRSRGTLVGTLFHTRRARADDRLAIATSFAVLNDVGLFTRSLDLTEMVPHGTLRLLEIARAMAADPMFVLLDEPAAGLSLGEAESLKAAVRTMARAGLGVLIVEHNLPVVFDIADVVTVLDEGRVISRGTPHRVSQDPGVIRVYIGRRNADAPRP
jgi:ABC-type branched-subunit amino acid transport system ATPase component